MNINDILKVGENANPNYLATICKIESTLPVVGADRLAKTVINGYDSYNNTLIMRGGFLL